MIDLVSCIPIYCFVLCQNQMKLTYYCFLYGSMSMILRVFNQGPEPYIGLNLLLYGTYYYSTFYSTSYDSYTKMIMFSVLLDDGPAGFQAR
jgi:hypothetical protein